MNKTKFRKTLISSAVLAVSAISVTAFILYSSNQGPFSGTVTDNDTGSPIANVCVTDGRNVVRTDENGNFKLRGWRKSHFVTVTVPSGYQTDAFYIPVDKSTESYDFTLNKSELTVKAEHCFLQISDTEIGEGGAGEWLENLKSIVKENNPAFLIHTGDICYEAGLKRHIKDMNTDTMGCTVRYVIGNHDYVDGEYGEQLYESLYGPVWYSFDIGNIHYVVTPFQTGDYPSAYGKNDRWKWLKNDLANVDGDKKVVLFNHTKSPSDDYVISLGRNEHDLKEHNLIAWVFGHYHYNYISENEGVLNISAPRPDCGGIDSSPAGTRIITVNQDGEISTRTDYYGSDAFAPPENALWSTKLQGNVLYCDMVYQDGLIYTATADDDALHECGIYCLDTDNGEVKWFYKTENSVKNNIIINGDRLFAQDADGNVYCLDKATGDSLWQPLKAGLSEGVGTSSGICIDNGVLYTGNPRDITAISLDDGSVKWTSKRNKGENSPAEFIVAGNKLIVSSHWDALAALDTESGKELWSNKDEDIRFRSSTPTAVDDETLLVADSDAVMLVSLHDGSIISKTEFDGYNFSSSGQPACRDGIAYIPTANKGVIAFDTQSKEILWNFETGESILFTAPYVGKGAKTVESSPIIDGENLLFGANDGYIYTIDRKTGNEIKKDFTGSAVMGKLAVDNGKIFAGTFDGYVICDEK